MKIAALVVAMCLPLVARAQHAPDRALDSLGDAAAAASRRYADRRNAAADGYHRIGPDFPGMGEHWLHPATLLTGRVSAEQPTMLIYATIRGTPTLLGVGFVATTDSVQRDRQLPGWPGAWHEHSGLLSDESGIAPGGATTGATHVWVLHVWTALSNREGRFLAENWDLPFVRAGLRVSPVLNADAARAVSLVSGGDRYIRDVLTDAAVRTGGNASRADTAIARSSARVRAIIGNVDPREAPVPMQLDALATEWGALVASLSAIVGTDVSRYLTPTHFATDPHTHAGMK